MATRVCVTYRHRPFGFSTRDPVGQSADGQRLRGGLGDAHRTGTATRPRDGPANSRLYGLGDCRGSITEQLTALGLRPATVGTRRCERGSVPPCDSVWWERGPGRERRTALG